MVLEIKIIYLSHERKTARGEDARSVNLAWPAGIPRKARKKVRKLPQAVMSMSPRGFRTENM